MRSLISLIAAVFSLGLAASAYAVEPREVLPDAALEARARAISAELRCLVCQNQSIDDSNAPLAKDLRVLVRERLVAGDTDRAATDYIVARYGDFVLLKPPVNSHTLLLWLTPLLCLVGLSYAVVRAIGRPDANGAPAPQEHLTRAEEEKLRSLLKTDAKG
jgi:cytochrome c-type biogenesis protein CcmH